MKIESITLKELICIIQFFIRINETEGLLIADKESEGEALKDIKLKVDPSKLNEINIFWKIIQEAKNPEVAEKAIKFLNSLYDKSVDTFITTFLDKLKATIEAPIGSLQRMIKLMENMISESEIKGIGDITPYNSLLKDLVLCLNIRNNLKFPKEAPNKLELEMYGNVTIWQFKVELAKYLMVSPECIELIINSYDIEDRDNGKLINSFITVNPSTVNVNRKIEKHKVNLLNENYSLSNEAKEAFSEIFNKFAVNDKLNLEGIVNFIKTTVEVNELSANDERVKFILNNFSKNKDNCLSLDEFLEFYRTALCEGNEESVREDLAVHGYRNDLQRIDKVKISLIDTNTLPRHVLSCNEDLFEMLFGILDCWGEVAGCVWDFICKLTVNPTIYNKVLSLTEDWTDIIDKRSTFRLLYTLRIVRSFVENKDNNDWRDKFIVKGGFSFLTSLIINRIPLNTMGNFEGKVLKCIECILGTLLDSAACTLNKDFIPARLNYSKIFNTEEMDKNSIFSIKPSTVFFPKYYYAKKDIVLDFILTEEQSKIVLDDIVNKEIWRQQLDLLADLLLSKNNLELIGPSLLLFCSCAYCDPSFFSLIESYNHNGSTFEDILLLGLLRFDSSLIRSVFVKKFRFLCFLYKDSSKANKLLTYVLQVLIRSIPKDNTDPVKYGEFFQLLCHLIDIYYEEEQKRLFDSTELIKKIISALKSYSFTEEQHMEMLLIGFIATIKKILNHEPLLKTDITLKEGLLHELFINCLYPPKNDFTKQKCKTRKTRMAAYKLLLSLCHKNTSILKKMVGEYVVPLVESLRMHNGWGYNPVEQSRSKLGYVGIKNLGCICYMNSILQQFYMIPTFRYGILSVECTEEGFLCQLQKMFAFLEASERQAYDPKDFCSTFKDLDGNPVNVKIQQDAHEFLNMAFERMESSLSNTSQRFLVRSVFGGKTCSQITCTKCGTIKTNLEDFYNISVEVKGLTTLFESLNKFTATDTISGYYCDTCNTKVDVNKRTTIYELPNVLIIHLQRIVFNFDYLMNIKITSRLVFPIDFSMKPYTLEGIIEEDYNYKLKGVVANIGLANAGHYYSFIHSNTWLEFNDSIISPFK